MLWISVKDRLPELAPHEAGYFSIVGVIIYNPMVDAGKRVKEAFYIADEFLEKPQFQNENGIEINNVTHWMLMPEPPEVKNENQKD